MMHIKNIIYWFYLFSPMYSFAKVPILLTPSVVGLISEEKYLLDLFQPLLQSNESSVIEKFIDNAANFAIVREDIFYDFLKNKKFGNIRYQIIGQLSKKAILYFFSKETSRIKNLQNKKISIGMLGDQTNGYLKNILKKQEISYMVNMSSMDFYHGLHSLKDNKIDAIFMFGSEHYRKNFIKYIQDYPKGFMSSLKDEKGLVCKNNSCYASYYLIASQSVGRPVMHNIYEQTMPILSSNKELTSNFGQYYIDLKQKKGSIEQRVKSENKVESFKSSRTPWMKVAIKEAIDGKGSAENRFPMLDLSYKYIRFSKGNKGITTAPNDSIFGSWCAAYVCWTLDKAGFKVHKKGRMASQSFRYFKNILYKKIDNPIFGAIALYTSKTNPLHGHVGYLYGHTIRGDNILLGGNQNNRLKFAAYPAKGFGSYRFNGFYIPKDYMIQKKDKLTRKDIYQSVKAINIKYGITKSTGSKKVR